MLPYWLIFGLFAFGALGWQQKMGGKLSLPLAVSAAILTLFIGLRYDVGADTGRYLLIFSSTEHRSLNSILNDRGDPGFYLFVWLAHKFELEILAAYVACAIVFVFVFGLGRRLMSAQPHAH